MDLSSANTMPLKEAAAFYASRGFPVFPIVANTKIPIKGIPWKLVATTDLEVIKGWWELYPNANIGLPMGKVAGVNCLDVDTKKGDDGFASFKALDTGDYRGPIQQTPSGGHHWFYEYEPGFINFTKKGTKKGLDFRTDAGYILGSPSVYEGDSYKWISPGEIEEASSKLRIFFTHCSAYDSSTVSDETPDTPLDLPDPHDLNIHEKYLDYLDNGNTDPWGNDESIAVFAVAGALMRATKDQGVTFGLMVTNDYAYSCAQRHRTRGNPADWLWKYGVGKIITEVKGSSASEVFKPLALSYHRPEPEKDLDSVLWPDHGPAIEQQIKVQPPKTFFADASQGFAYYLRPTVWLIQGILEKAQTGALYGPSGAYKTFIALDMCLHLSLGLPWHGKTVYFEGYCMYVSAEGQGAIWRRVEAWRQHYNKGKDGDETVSRDDIVHSGFVISTEGVDLLDVKSMQPIADLVESRQVAPQLIVFDTLASNMYGNENSTEDMSRVVNNAKVIGNAYDCSVMFIHHTGHSDTGRMRGASALYAGVDFVLQVEKQKGEGRYVEVHGTKAKDSSEIKPICFELEVVSLITMANQDGSPTTSLAPKLVEQRFDKVALKTQMKITKSQTVLLNSCLEHIDGLKKLGTVSHDDDQPKALYSELYEMFGVVYEGINGKKQGAQNNFNVKINTLVKAGYLDQVVLDGVPWITVPGKKKGVVEDEDED